MEDCPIDRPESPQEPGDTLDDIAPSAGSPVSAARRKLDQLAYLRIRPDWLVISETSRVMTGGFASVTVAVLRPPDVERSTAAAAESIDLGDTQNFVAVKKLKIGPDGDKEKMLRAFTSEAGIMAKLSHPNVVRLEAFVEDAENDIFWMVLPWEANGNLREFVLSKDCVWEVPELMSLQNILVNSERRAVITDFGSARIIRNISKSGSPFMAPDVAAVAEVAQTPLQVEVDSTTQQLNVTGCLFSARWAAPEILFKGEPELASDIWAFGWICWEVITGKLPFHDAKRTPTIFLRVAGRIMPPLEDEAQIGQVRRLCKLITDCWKYDSNARPNAEQCKSYVSKFLWIHPRPMGEGASEIRSLDLLLQLGWLRSSNDDQISARQYFCRTLVTSVLAQDAGRIAASYVGLGSSYAGQRDFSMAVNYYQEALKIYGEDDIGRALTLMALGQVQCAQGEYAAAMTSFTGAQALLTRIGDRQHIARVSIHLGHVYFIQSDFPAATSALRKALEIYNQDGYGPNELRATALLKLGMVHAQESNYDSAVSLYGQAIEIYEQLRDQHGKACVLIGLGDVQNKCEDYEDALSSYREAREIFMQCRDRMNECLALQGLGEVHHFQGQYATAMSF